MTDELGPDRVGSLHEQLERRLAVDLDVDATWARVQERIAASKIVPMPVRRRSRRIVVLAVAAALVVSGSALAGMRQQIADAGHPAPGSAHPPTLTPANDRENGTGRAEGTLSDPNVSGTASDDGDDPAQDEAPATDGHDDDGQGAEGGDDSSGAADQVDEGSGSGDQVQDLDQTLDGGNTSDGQSSDGGTDSAAVDGQNEG